MKTDLAGDPDRGDFPLRLLVQAEEGGERVVDADLGDPRTVTTLVKIPSVEAIMKQASGRMLVLDSCRNNPADGWRQKWR